MLRIVPYAAFHFAAYERFRELLLNVVDGFDRGQQTETARSQQPAKHSEAAGQHRQCFDTHSQSIQPDAFVRLSVRKSITAQQAKYGIGILQEAHQISSSSSSSVGACRRSWTW